MLIPPIVFVALLILGSRAQEPNQTNTNALEKLTIIRKVHRKTIDGRLCAAAFVQDGQTFTDCTNTKAPDSRTGKEWCYVETQLLGKGSIDWNLCAPPIYYDKVRVKANDSFQIKVFGASKMVDELERQVRKLNAIENRFTLSCENGHKSTGDRIDKISSLVNQSQNCVQRIEDSLVKISLVETSINQVEEEAQKIRETGINDPHNCEIIRGYEDVPLPDGIRVSFYDNPRFDGHPKLTRIDQTINIGISKQTIIKGISTKKFSVRWDGFLIAPHSGKFIISTESSCGARVFLNNHNIIVDRMPEAKSPSEADDEGTVNLILSSGKFGVQKVDSDFLDLEAGTKYRLRVEMIYSDHLVHKEHDSIIMKLLWKSNRIETEVIPSSSFFNSNSMSPIKLSGLKPDEFEIGILYNGQKAFANDVDEFIADLPPRYEGRKLLKAVTPFPSDTFTIKSNIDSTLFIASLIDESLPIALADDSPKKIHDTTDIFAVRGKNNLEHSSGKIYKIKFLNLFNGEAKFEVLNKTKPFILFLEPKLSKNRICGINEEVLSTTDGPYYETCESSSFSSAEHDCRAGFSGVNVDKAGGMWRTSGNDGVGEFIAVQFNKEVQINMLRFYPRDDPVYYPAEIMVSFSKETDEESQVIAIRQTSNVQENYYDLKKPVVTNYIKVEISQMSNKGEKTGGSFEFIGVPCIQTETKSQHEPYFRKVQIDSCQKTAENLPEVLPLSVGEPFEIICPASCISHPEGVVFGTRIYSTDSTLCTSTIHANVCHADEKPCSVLVTVGEKMEYFIGSTSNAVASKSMGPRNLSITFSKPNGLDQIQNTHKYYKISFQPKNPDLPADTIFDVGEMKTFKNNLKYGWMTKTKPLHCKTNIKNPYDMAGIEFPLILKNEQKFPNFWSIRLPHRGLYRIEVQVGNNCAPETGSRYYYLQVNGKNLISEVALEKQEYYWASMDLNVEDNIILTSICDSDLGGEEKCMNAITTIMNLTIIKLDDPEND